MRKAVLFPFEISENNKLTYTRAMTLARVNQLPVVCFTTVSPETTETDMDAVYLHLLQLEGYYQTHVNDWYSGHKAKAIRVIKKGNFKQQLKQFIAQAPITFVLA